MSRRRWWWAGLALLLLAGIGLWAALGRGDRGPAFETVAIAPGTLVEEISANGVINPVRVVSVGSQVSGTVARLHADFNDQVAQGQLLAELDPQLFRARLAQSEAALANARAQAALAQANRRRAAELKRQDFISQQDDDQAEASARSQAAQVRSAEAAVAQDRANLGFSIIRSPVAGVVIARQVDVGQTVAASFQTPTLFTIARDLADMQIEASVAEADIGRVAVGQRVDFTVDAHPERVFTGTVAQVRLNPVTQQNVVTFTVVVSVANPDGALLPGMTANARFRVKEHSGVLLVPNAALSWKPADWTRQRSSSGGGSTAGTQGTVLFVAGADGAPEPRTVRLGASDAERSIVLAGLKAGERVIVGVADRARGGARGEVQRAPPRPGEGG